MTLGEVGEALRHVLDKIAQAIGVAHGAAELAEEARGLIGAAGHGTLQSDVEEVQGLFTKVVEGISEPEGFTSGLATVADSIRVLEQRWATGDSGSRAATPASSASREQGSPEHLSSLRDQLHRLCENEDRRHTGGGSRQGSEITRS